MGGLETQAEVLFCRHSENSFFSDNHHLGLQDLVRSPRYGGSHLVLLSVPFTRLSHLKTPFLAALRHLSAMAQSG